MKRALTAGVVLAMAGVALAQIPNPPPPVTGPVPPKAAATAAAPAPPRRRKLRPRHRKAARC